MTGLFNLASQARLAPKLAPMHDKDQVWQCEAEYGGVAQQATVRSRLTRVECCDSHCCFSSQSSTTSPTRSLRPSFTMRLASRPCAALTKASKTGLDVRRSLPARSVCSTDPVNGQRNVMTLSTAQHAVKTTPVVDSAQGWSRIVAFSSSKLSYDKRLELLRWKK